MRPIRRPLTRVVSGLAGVHDLDDPVLARLTRDACYDTLLALAEANLRAGRPVVLVAPSLPWHRCHRWQSKAESRCAIDGITVGGRAS